MSLKLLFKAFFYHHLFMAICATSLCWQTFVLLHKNAANNHLYLFVFFATLLSYNTHFFLASKKSKSSLQLQWFNESKKITLIFNALVLLATLYYFYFLKDISIYILLAVVFNVAYTAPLLFKNALKLPLAFTFVKSYFIGFTWVFATAILPMLVINQKPGLPEIALLIHRFFLVSIATLIFDYRDKLRDLELGVHTPANKMEEHQFQWFYIFNLMLMTVSVVFLYSSTKQAVQWLQLIPCAFLWWAFLQSKKRKDDMFYLSLVDGVLFLSAILSIFLLI